MTGLLHAETLKLRTVPLPRLMLILAALGAGFIAFAVVHTANAEHTTVSPHTLATAVAAPLWFLAIVVAVMASAGEFQHRTIQPTLLQVPHRRRLLLAKTLAAAAYGATITLLGTLCAIVVGLISLRITGMPTGPLHPELVGTIAATTAIGALWAILAVGLGLLTRSTALALVALLLWRFVIEGILPVITQQPHLTQWMPSRTADALLSNHPDLLQPWAAGLLLAGYVAAVTAAAAWLFNRWET
jgi:ABC-2 type transport system permease protein